MKSWPSSTRSTRPVTRPEGVAAGPPRLHDLFAARAAAAPEAVALVWRDERLSYRELAHRSGRLARRLEELGVGPEGLVALYLGRSPALVTAALAVLRAGGAYVPLDPGYPAERVAFILADTAAPVVLSESHRAGDLPPSRGRVLCLDEPEATPVPDRTVGEATAGAATAHNLAYVIYTSGSTGRPKGVAIEHASAVALVEWARQAFAPEELAGVLASTSICFDLSVFELWVTLGLGGTVVLVGDALELPRLGPAAAVTLINSVPSAVAELLRDGPLPPSVRTVNLAGEPLRRSLADDVYRCPGVQRLLNLYGPSEDTTYSTIAVIPRRQAAEPAIGQPVTGTCCQVLDERGRPVPEGEAGELLLGGAGLARGYLRRPAQTAERWVPDPFGGEPGGRLYRTGDRAARREDGELLFLGRLDHQVKLRGFRIELGEIESALTHQEGVREAVVVVREDRAGERRLAAYVEPTGEVALERAELRRALAARLPAYMVPAALVPLPALPRTPNGKVDRNRLPVPGRADLGAAAEGEGDRAALLTPMEELVAGLWRELLGVERVGRHDDFLALGGHSLLATRVLSRLRRELGVELTPGALLAAPTVAALAAAVEEARGVERRHEPPLELGAPGADLPGGPGGVRRALASFDQERLWFVQRMQPRSPFYNIPLGLELTGPLAVAALDRALAEILRRHQALRTRLPEVDGRPQQVVEPPPPPPLALLDLTALTAPARPAAADSVTGREMSRPFDLTRGPVARFLLLRLGPGEHRLVLTLHHIVADDGATSVLTAELGRLYDAFHRGEPSPLPELPLQYADYVAWQRRRLTSDLLERQLSYWSRQLAGAGELLELPTDRSRPAAPSHRGGRLALALSPERTRALERLGRRRGATLFMVLLAAWQALLGRLSGQDDVAVGSPMSGRSRLELEGLIGFFLNTLVLRLDLGGDPGFGELVTRVRESALGAYAHQDVPFERVVEVLGGQRDPSRNSLFQAAFTLQSLSPAPPALPGIEARWLALHNGTAKLDLGLELEEREGGVVGWMEYSSDLFDATTARRMRAGYETLLAAVAADPERPLSRLPLLTTAQRHQLLAEWSGGSAPAGLISGDLTPSTLLTAFARQAQRAPDARAVSAGDELLTYGEVAGRSRALAGALQAQGVGPEKVVAVCLERRPELPVALLGVLAAGAAYLPLDPSHPEERLAFMLTQARVPVLLAGVTTRARLPEAVLKRVHTLDPGAVTAGEAAGVAPAPPAAGPESLAYVLYTSGSTGKPKGVACAHAGVLNLLADFQFRSPVDAGDLCTLWTSLGFDVSVYEIFSALTAGAALHLVDETVRPDSGAFLDELVRRRVTSAYVPPFMLPELAARAAGEGGGGLTLRRLLVGVEPIPEGVLSTLDRALPGLAVINGYGPTEATVCATLYDVGPEPRSPDRKTPIGRPVRGTDVLLLDRRLDPVPPGVPGELFIGGPGLARGYLHRPARTAESFVPHAYAAVPGARLYRTGDLARHLGDGVLEFMGRVDFQLKVRGFRVEAGEVEAALLRHPGVGEVVTLLRRDRPGDPQLVVYVVPAGDPAPGRQELLAHLQERLPAYMVPSAIVFLDELPRTPNDKVDRKALPAPAPEEGASAVYTAPRTPLEEMLAGIWAEVLGLERVGREDDFFALGGHSLLATQAVSRIQRHLDLEVPIQALFQHPTVAGLARLLEEAGRAAPPPLQPQPREGDAPLSFAQERLWFLDRLQPGSATYNIPLALDFEGGLQPRALMRSLEEIIRRHEILRTTFPAVGGQPRQQLQPPARLLLPRLDLRRLQAAGEEEVHRLSRREAQRPFDLARGSVLRGLLLHLDGGRWRLLLTVHHIASDGWSTGVLLRELGSLYPAVCRGEASPLPPLPVQYADFALWQRRWLAGDVEAKQLAYWRRQLAGAQDLLQLPTDRPRPPVKSDRGSLALQDFAPELTPAARRCARREGATLFMVLLAAFQALLGRLCDQLDLVTGAPVAGRHHGGVEELVGLFVNTVALRADLTGDPDFRQLVARTRSVAMGAYAHQDLPFDRVVEELRPRRDTGRTPLFQVLFALQHGPVRRLELPELDLTLRELHSGTSKFDLALFVDESEGRLDAALEYSTDLFDLTTARRLLRHFEALLAAATADPDRRLSELPLLTAVEAHQMLREWNDTAPARPLTTTIPDLFVRQAAARPDGVALELEAEQVSFGELERRANRLAHRLGALGVGPEVAVALSLPRSLELVVTLLAILEAGGAYLPLDPDSPPERLARMVEEAGAPLVLTRDPAGELPPAGRARVVDLAAEAEAVASCPATPPEVPIAAENLAYVLYTSGSTGRPKGVAVTHRSVARLVSEPSFMTLSPAEVFLQLAPVAFDASTLELWGPLLNGGRLVIFPPRLGSLEEVARVVEERGVNALWLTAGLFHSMVEDHLDRLGGVRQLLAGGDVLAPAQVARVRRRWPGTAMINGYGPTENTTFTACHRVGRVTPALPVPIGRPVSQTRVHVVSPAFQPLPAGAVGELVTAGAGLARGYFRRPARTAEAFVPDPFAASGGRLYRTGDLVRRRPDGVLEFLGRRDGQVKLRGFRIELGEVESALAEHPGVAAAAVLMTGREAGERRLVAYLEAPGPAPAAAEELRAHLEARLPSYMVPSAYVFLDTLPLTANGKVDRRALAALAPERPAAVSQPPRGDTEERVAAVWSSLLGVEAVGREDDFFALGGHSLLAMRVLFRLKEALGVEIPAQELFQHPTVAGLARRIEALEAERAAAPPPIEPLPREGDLPLSFAQERLWFLDRLQPSSAFYNVPTPLRLRGPLDLRALAASLSEVVRRHESLRTTFPEVEGGPRQRIQPPAPVRPAVVELGGLAPARRQATARRLLAREARRPFDLERGPLLRVALLRLDGEEWLLLLTAHHIVTDGWSVGVLGRELEELYRARRRGEPAALPPLAVQYADFAVWQRCRLEAGALDGSLAAWSRRLAGAPDRLRLPTDRPRPAVESHRGARLPFTLDAADTEALRRLGRRQGTTLFVLLLAAWQSLLGRLCGQEDLVVGSPVANRDRPETEGLIGFFVNTLALRGDLSGDPPFLDHLAAVRRVTLAALEHSEAPFERVVEALGVERRLSHSPLFQTVLAVHEPDVAPPALAGLQVAWEEVDTGTAKLDLSLEITATEAGLVGSCEYGSDLFDPTTVHRLLRQLRTLLRGVTAAPERRLSALPLLAAGERHQLCREWSWGSEPGRALAPVHLEVGDWARRSPAAAALTVGEETISYGELAGRAVHLAQRLRRLGLGPEEVAGIACGPSAEQIVAVLATLAAGGAYVPLPDDLPAARLEGILADCRPRVLLWGEGGGMGEIAGAAAPAVLNLQEEAPPAGGEGAAETLAAALVPAGDQLAYILYTSGSTGVPNGVQVLHGPLANTIAQGGRDFMVGPSQRVLRVVSFAFDASVLETFVALCHGATLCIARPDERLPGASLDDLLLRRRVTWATLTPSVLALQDPALPLALQVVAVGGEKCTGELAARWATRLCLINCYGPTEATIYATRAVCPRDGAGDPPIGRPIAGLEAWVLDRRGWPVPAAVAGQLHLAGAGLTRGYLQRPALTAQRFIPHPWAEGPGRRLYATGDLVRRRADGQLEYLGRLDFQVKLRGLRIELGEVEAALATAPGVGQAVAVVRETAAGGQLVAYLVGREGVHPDTKEVGEHLRSRLPGYMVPTALVVLEELPRTPIGKVDRRALPEPVVDAAAAPTGPRTATEATLVGIWRELLGQESLGVDDDFFALGGHSLLATRLVSRVRRQLAVELAVREVFLHPTLAELAAEIERRRQGATGAPAVTPVPREGDLPLSFAQERLWFLQRLDPESTSYNSSVAIALAGELAVAALDWTFREIVRRHEVLRTRFVERGGRPVQVIDPGLRQPFPLVDLSGLPAAARGDLCRRLAGQQAWRPFDLARDPLLRTTLVRLAPAEHWLVLTHHHIVFDGWSVALIVDEMVALYTARRAGEPSPLPELPLQYADFGCWQRRWLEGGELERQLAYWRDRLGDRPPSVALPPDRPRRSGEPGSAGSVDFTLGEPVTSALLHLGREHGATLFMVLLAAFQALLQGHGGGETVQVGTLIANRNRAEIEGLVGFFVNTLVLRADFPDGLTVVQLLEQVRDRTLEAYGHQDAPFEKVVEALRPVAGDASLFQALFTLQNLELTPFELPGLEVSYPPLAGERTALFDLTCGMFQAEGRLQGVLEYNQAVFDRTTVQRLARRFVHLLDAFAADLERPVAALPLLAAAEGHQLVHEWSHAEVEAGRWSRLAQRFGERPATAPPLPAEPPRALLLLDGHRRPVPLGAFGRLHAEVDEAGLVDLGVRARHSADGRLELPADTSPAPAAGAEPAAVEDEARLRSEIDQRRSRLSAKQQELMARRLRGRAGARRGGEAQGAGIRRRPSPCRITLQPRGDRPPLYLPHPGGGSVLSYHDLVRALGEERPVHAFEAVGLGGGEPPLESVEAMAERFVDELLSAPPQESPAGPWHLAGWSFGGYLAFEMAQRLRSRGVQIGRVVLLDAHAQQLGRTFYRDGAELLVAAFEDLLPLDLAELRCLDPDQQFPHALEEACRAGVVPPDLDPRQAQAYFAVLKANIDAYATYRPQPYPGPLHLLRAAEPWQGADEPPPDLGWEPLAGRGLEILEVPGHHYNMLQPPHVQVLAQRLAAVLAAWEAAEPVAATPSLAAPGTADS